MLPSVASANNERLREAFFKFIDDRNFPCVGAKSALASDTITTCIARDIRSAWDDLKIHEELCAFSTARDKGLTRRLRSFAILFSEPAELTETEFEAFLWARLQSLCDKDRWLSFRHDQRVDADPQSPNFAFSVGGEAYFVVGMHPGANRTSRRTPRPVLVFNPFAQFAALRANGKYNRMSDVIRARDEVACGSANPMLSHHGEGSAARQFSGRIVGNDWVCPLHAPT